MLGHPSGWPDQPLASSLLSTLSSSPPSILSLPQGTSHAPTLPWLPPTFQPSHLLSSSHTGLKASPAMPEVWSSQTSQYRVRQEWTALRVHLILNDPCTSCFSYSISASSTLNHTHRPFCEKMAHCGLFVEGTILTRVHLSKLPSLRYLRNET